MNLHKLAGATFRVNREDLTSRAKEAYFECHRMLRDRRIKKTTCLLFAAKIRAEFSLHPGFCKDLDEMLSEFFSPMHLDAIKKLSPEAYPTDFAKELKNNFVLSAVGEDRKILVSLIHHVTALYPGLRSKFHRVLTHSEKVAV